MLFVTHIIISEIIYFQYTFILQETTDPEVTRVFKEKLYTQPFKEAFTTVDVGMEKIRKGLYAYHGLAEAYKTISDTYEDHEKCRFKEIKMFTSSHMSITAKKGSPYTPHIKERCRKLRNVTENIDAIQNSFISCHEILYRAFNIDGFIYLLIMFQNPYTGVCPMDMGTVKD